MTSMNEELEQLKEENSKLKDLVKRMAIELSPFCDGGRKRDDLVKEALELLNKRNN